MNKEALRKKINSIDALSKEEKAELTELLNTKRYGLVWEDKPETVEEELKTQLPVLMEVTEKKIVGSRQSAVGSQQSNFDSQPVMETIRPQISLDFGTDDNIRTGLKDFQDGQDLMMDKNNPEHPVKSLNPVLTSSVNHALIEGDNLHALTVFNYTHANKIDVIYIDPPYNTGREDEFRYNDKWILKEDPFRHSSWLSFMIKRLKLAKNLLSNNGVMILHIDENEFDALNLLLETEIFSEDSFLGVIIWNKQNPKGDAKSVASMHEYVLVYAKNKSEFTSLENSLLRPKPNAQKILNKAKKLFSKIGKVEIPEEIKEVIKPFNFSKEILKDFEIKYDLELVNKEFQSWINRQDFSGGEKAYKFIDKNGKVWQSVSMAWPNKEQAPDDYLVPLIHPHTNKPCPIPARGWRNPTFTMKTLIEKELILFGEDEKTQPRRKYLLQENMFENTPSIFNNGVSDDAFFKEIGIEFAYPKPVEVAKYFLQSIHPNPKKILDFFAGSGTTLHAVMALNAEDGGSRQCILVTNNEVDAKTAKELEDQGILKGTEEFEKHGICQEVTYERNKRVIEGYTNAKGDFVAGLGGNNLRYYRTGYVGRERTLKNKKALVNLATEMLCLKEGVYQEKKVGTGFKDLQDEQDFKENKKNPVHPDNLLNPVQKFIRVFEEDDKAFMIIYDEEFIDEAVALIQQIEIPNAIKVYVFANGQYPYTEDFEEVLDKIELCALPDAIYRAYQRLLPKEEN